MSLNVLKTLAENYRSAIALGRLMPHRFRSTILSGLAVLVTLFFIPTVVYIMASFLPELRTLIFSFSQMSFFLPKLAGIFCLLFAAWLVFFMMESFFFSYYFKALDSILNERGIGEREPISFGVAELVLTGDDEDLTKSFLNSEEGELVLHRSGLIKEDIDAFLKSRKSRVNKETFKVDSVDHEYGITMVDYGLALLRSDREFSKFLFTQGIQEHTFEGALEWVVYSSRVLKKGERWWSRDNLGRIEGLGKDWAYGGAYILDKYAKKIFDKGTSLAAVSSNFLHDEVDALEKVLSKSEEANALVVGETESGPRDVVLSFARRIQEGKVLPLLEHKRVVMLDTSRLIALKGKKADFEIELLQIMKESIEAGNIILVFDDFSGFIQSAQSIGSDVLSILDPFIASARIQIIAIADKARFHTALEPNALVMSRFERILLQTSGLDSTMRVLEVAALAFEHQYGILFTYPALEAVAQSADRYVTGGVMPDKAVDMLVLLAPSSKLAKKKIVTKEDVLAFVETKTGIPTGPVTEIEKDKLLNLESLLHKRVIGQDEAVSAIANAMRRSRSGLGNPNRPMGSFLFLGPTGVGKTETTKALAESFFGSTDKIIRLDMSEYKSEDAMDKLIGSFTTKSPGVLSNLLREHPYGVLLLDEFEKSTTAVRDLFLQVLDEGFFSDMAGNRINARNLIIIATSNAGADLIWNFLKQGGDLNSHKNEIIDGIIKAGTYRPELLNRFDGVILFHPVDDAHLKDIARLSLETFRKQIRERGVDLVINDALVNYLAKFGTDPKFGARPINRAIQDTIEQNIADRLIKGDIKVGESVTFSTEELAKMKV